LTVFKLLRIAKPENQIFFLGKNLILRTVLISPLFYSEIKNQLDSHIEAKNKNKKPKTNGSQKKVRTAQHGMDVYYGGAGSLAGKSDPQKKDISFVHIPSGAGVILCEL
jgi:hypothetical protein